ncbi:MAG: hypothetical protein ACYC7D_06155 [Nitrososphaerales archaeon]
MAAAFGMLFLLVQTSVTAAAFSGGANVQAAKVKQGTVYVANEYSGAFVIKGSTLLNLKKSPIVGAGIQAAYDPSNKKAYFPYNSEVTVLNTKKNKVVSTITGFNSAEAVLYDPSNNNVYVYGAGGDLYVINTATNAMSVELNLGILGFTFTYYLQSSPIMAYSTSTNEIYLVDAPSSSCSSSCQGQIWVYDPAGNTTSMISLPTSGCPCYPASIGFDPANNNIYVGDIETGSIYVINSANTYSATLGGVGGDPKTSFAYNPSNQLLYVADNGNSFGGYGYVITLSSSNSVGYINSIYFNQPSQLAYNTYNQMIYVVSHGNDEVFPISGTTVGTGIGLHVQLAEIVAT